MTSDARQPSAADATTAPMGAGARGGEQGQASGSGSNPGMQLYTATETTDEGVSGSLQMIIGDGCCFLWVGPAATSAAAPPLGSLCVAAMTPYDALPVSSVLLRDAAEDDLAQSLAHRLAKRTGLQVLASCSLQPGDPKHLPLLAALERRALGVLTESN